MSSFLVFFNYVSVYCGSLCCGWNSIVSAEHAASSIMLIFTYKTTQYYNAEQSKQSLQQNSENMYMFKL